MGGAPSGAKVFPDGGRMSEHPPPVFGVLRADEKQMVSGVVERVVVLW